MIEKQFDVPFVARLALREKQVQQNYRPIIAVHKWFARRPGTLFRSLLLSEFVDDNLQRSYFRSHDIEGKLIADPYMGGGTPLIEANRIGIDVLGCDINPMAYWIVKQELEHLDLSDYSEAYHRLIDALTHKIGHLYHTRCEFCDDDVPVKYFIWVKTHECVQCTQTFDLFRGYLLADDTRHTRIPLG